MKGLARELQQAERRLVAAGFRESSGACRSNTQSGTVRRTIMFPQVSQVRNWLWGRPAPARIVLGLACLAVVATLFAPNHLAAAPKFTRFKLKTLDGTLKTLEDYKGKATLVGFFFPTCAFCNAAFPEMVKIYDKYKDQGLTMVWINVLPEEEEKIADWLAEHQYTIPVLMGASTRALQRAYKIRQTPEHFLVNEKREILFRHGGYKAGDEKEVEENVRKALGLE
jgi:peroxiredoxin